MREMKSVKKARKQTLGFLTKTTIGEKKKRKANNRRRNHGGTPSFASSLYGSLLLQLRSRNRALKLNEICCDDTSVIDLRLCMVYILSFVEIKTEADNLLLARHEEAMMMSFGLTKDVIFMCPDVAAEMIMWHYVARDGSPWDVEVNPRMME
ncbi:uncharacterized protein LOC110929232 isoform X2 [Helianthus annuus]|uniref:uncharacterized protein LOC110929232 isoform X2 n=1 Tax=Helianthus annuus TaxID=4232 RepID=UPI000B90A31D|nr:uncharacterized protein LOC110929232 isoform X2 [Helianthus annuus]